MSFVLLAPCEGYRLIRASCMLGCAARVLLFHLEITLLQKKILAAVHAQFNFMAHAELIQNYCV